MTPACTPHLVSLAPTASQFTLQPLKTYRWFSHTHYVLFCPNILPSVSGCSQIPNFLSNPTWPLKPSPGQNRRLFCAPTNPLIQLYLCPFTLFHAIFEGKGRPLSLLTPRSSTGWISRTGFFIYIYLTALDEGRDWVCLYFTAAFSEAS